MITLKISVELPDKVKTGTFKCVYRNHVNVDDFDFPFESLVTSLKFLYGSESIINFSLI